MEVVRKKCCPDGTCGAGADGVSEPLEVEVAAIVGVTWLRRTRSSLPRHTKIKSPENTMFWRQWQKQQKWKINTAMNINKTWSHWLKEIRVNYLNHTMFSTFVATIAAHCRSRLGSSLPSPTLLFWGERECQQKKKILEQQGNTWQRRPGSTLPVAKEWVNPQPDSQAKSAFGTHRKAQIFAVS